MDDVERDDLGYSETEMTGADWSEPLRQLSAESEQPGPPRGETPEEEQEPEGEDVPVEALVLEHRAVPERLP